jgi:hypothetical protein
MPTSFNLDPFDMWRQAATKLEEGMNALGAQTLKSDKASKALLEISTASMQMQHAMQGALGKYFKALNLPSRKDVVELAATLRSIDDKLDQLLLASSPPTASRPARTRVPGKAPSIQATPESTVPGPAQAPKQQRRAAGAKRARKEA